MTKTKKLKMILTGTWCLLFIAMCVLGSIFQGVIALTLTSATIFYFIFLFFLSPVLDAKIKKEVDEKTAAMNELLNKLPE